MSFSCGKHGWAHALKECPACQADSISFGYSTGTGHYMLHPTNGACLACEKYKTTAFQAQTMAIEVSKKCAVLEGENEKLRAVAEAAEETRRQYIKIVEGGPIIPHRDIGNLDKALKAWRGET